MGQTDLQRGALLGSRERPVAHTDAMMQMMRTGCGDCRASAHQAGRAPATAQIGWTTRGHRRARAYRTWCRLEGASGCGIAYRREHKTRPALHDQWKASGFGISSQRMTRGQALKVDRWRNTASARCGARAMFRDVGALNRNPTRRMSLRVMRFAKLPSALLRADRASLRYAGLSFSGCCTARAGQARRVGPAPTLLQRFESFSAGAQLCRCAATDTSRRHLRHDSVPRGESGGYLPERIALEMERFLQGVSRAA